MTADRAGAVDFIPLARAEWRESDFECRIGAAMQADVAGSSSWAIRRGGRCVGWLGLVPGEVGYAAASVYVIPAERNHGAGLYSLAFAMGRHLNRRARAHGLEAWAANPMDTNPQAEGLRRYCRAIGLEESGAVLPMRGPVYIRRLSSDVDAVDGWEIARRCMPDMFGQAAMLGAIMWDNPVPGALALLTES